MSDLAGLCGPDSGEGIDAPIVRAPCAADDPCIGLEQSAATGWKPRWFLKDGCLRAALKICSRFGLVEPSSPDDRLLTDSQLLWVKNPDSGEECLVTLPPPYSDCVCSGETPSCDGFVPEGGAGQTVSACDSDVCVSWTNTSAWPVCVVPKWNQVCARLAAGPARLEVPFTVNGTANKTVCIVETGSVAVSAGDGGDPAHTHPVTVDVATPAVWSGVVELRPVIVQPGDTIEVCASPQVTTTGNVDTPFSVSWGDYWLCLETTSQITGETIAALAAGN